MKKGKRTRHHIVPKSRTYNRPVVAMVRDYDHQLYHKMFSNSTPTEIIIHLVHYYWAGDWQYVIEALSSIVPERKQAV